jgi:hypothetical protein
LTRTVTVDLRTSSGSFATIRRASSLLSSLDGTPHLRTGEKRYKPNRLSDLILDNHNQVRIVAAAVFPKLTDRVLGIIKRRRNIW